MKIIASGSTDVGCVREHNEDAFIVRQDLPLLIVADGVGGAAAGEVASQLFVSQCEYEFNNNTNLLKNPQALITRCFNNGNEKIKQHTEIHPETRSMACTAEVLTLHNYEYFIGHIGDSRSYLLRDGAITQLTKDHSYIQEQMDLGLITPEEAKTHRLKNAIYQAIGFGQDVDVDFYQGQCKAGDIFLLCSDGLSDLVSDEMISTIVQRSDVLEDRIQNLINEAKAQGGKDNITVVLCEIQNENLGERITPVLNKIKKFLSVK